MDYKDHLAPELKKTARRVPFNRKIVQVGNIYQAAALKLTRIPGDISVKTIETEGYKGLKFKTDIFTPDDVDGPAPALIYVHGGAFCYKAAVYHKKLACNGYEKDKLVKPCLQMLVYPRTAARPSLQIRNRRQRADGVKQTGF